MTSDVEITGHLELSLDDDRVVDVTGHGSRIRAEIGELGPKRPGLRFVLSSAMLARRLARVLHARTLTLSITRNGEPLVELGAGVSGSPLARLFGFRGIRVFGKK
ncbi:MAG: hypothetical protein NVS2B8_03020 [Vulcanimicrobiaceae bacterium]